MAKPPPLDIIDDRCDDSERISHHGLYQTVQKIKGYKYPGIIVSIFTTIDGKIRYVVEADHPDFKGMLHIFSDADLEER